MAEDEKPWPEPAPNWPEAKQVWKWGWPFHVWFFAALYSGIVFRSLYVLYKQVKDYIHRRVGNKTHRLFMNLLLLSFGFARAVVFFWDPYGSNPDHTKVELVACIIVFGIGTSCITSAFSMLLLIVLESTRISLAPSKFQDLSFLLGVFGINVLYVTASDLTVAHVHSAKIMILVCQITFAAWGIFIAFGYTVAGYRLWRNVRSSRETALYDSSLMADNRRLQRLISLMYASSVCGVVLFSAIIYSALGETSVFNETGEVNDWPWFAVQTLLRSSETAMCLLIFVIAFKTSTVSSTSTSNRVSNELKTAFTTK